MISTAGTENNRGTAVGALDASAVPADRRVRVAAMASVVGGTADQKSADHHFTAEVGASFGGHVWLRPAATDVLVPSMGHPAWSPPT